MVNLNGFNANEVDPNVGFEPIPAREYEVMLIKSERKQSKNDPSGRNHYIECVFQVLTGEYKGRLLFERLNLENSNPDCVRIARGTLSAICRGVNVMKPNDTTDLHNIPLIAKVKLVKRKDTGDDANEIDSFKAKPSALGQQSAVSDKQSASDTTPPWQS